MAIVSRNELKNEFKNGAKPTEDDFADWIDSFNHKTEDAVQAIEVASVQEVENGTFNDKMMTPLRTKHAVKFFARLSKIAELESEVQDKIDTTITNFKSANLDAHTDRRDNPHGVTKEQVKLGNLPNAKDDSTDLSSSKTLATSRAVYDAKREAIAAHGDLPNAKSDDTDLDNGSVLATSKAVYDAKREAIAAHSDLPNAKSNFTNLNEPNVLATSKAVYDAKSEAIAAHGDLPNAKSNFTSLNNVNVLATSKAVYDAKREAIAAHGNLPNAKSSDIYTSDDNVLATTLMVRRMVEDMLETSVPRIWNGTEALGNLQPNMATKSKVGDIYVRDVSPAAASNLIYIKYQNGNSSNQDGYWWYLGND